MGQIYGIFTVAFSVVLPHYNSEIEDSFLYFTKHEDLLYIISIPW